MSKAKNYILANRLTVGMLEDMCKQVPNKKSVVQVADKRGHGVEPVLRAFLQEGKKRNKGLVLCGGFTFKFDEDETDIDPMEDCEIPFDPDNRLSPEKAALVCAWLDYIPPEDRSDLQKGLETL